MSLAVLQSGLVQDVFSRVADFFGTSRVLVVEKVIRVAVVWLVAWLAYQLVKRVARRIIKAVDDGDDSTMTAAEKRGHTVAQLVRSVGREGAQAGIVEFSDKLFALDGFGRTALGHAKAFQNMVCSTVLADK